MSFLQDSASELLYPILPLFLTVQLGAPVAVVGIIEGVADGAAAVVKLFAGRMSDRRTRRPFIGLGYGAAAAGNAIVAVSSVWPLVLVGRIVDRLGKGIRAAPRDALLMVGVERADAGRVFGFHRAADTAGAVVGPLLAWAGTNCSATAATSVRSSSSLWCRQHSPSRSSVWCESLVVRATTHHRCGRAVQLFSLPGSFWRPVGVLVGLAVLNFPDSLLLLRAHELGLGVAGVVVAYALYNAVYALASYPAGALSDRLGPRRVFALVSCLRGSCYASGDVVLLVGGWSPCRVDVQWRTLS